MEKLNFYGSVWRRSKLREGGILELAGSVQSPQVDSSNAMRKAVDEDHAMDSRVHYSIFALLFFGLTVNGKLGNLKVCVVGNPEVKSRTTKHCELLGKTKRTEVSCVYASDRLECLSAVSKRKADFSVFEGADLYFSTLWDESSLLVVSEIRGLRDRAYRHGVVAMVKKGGNSAGFGGVRGRRLCHPGAENGPEWTRPFAEYLEERVAPSDCEGGLSLNENRIKASSEFFSSGCKAGPWSPNAEEDARLKAKYLNLCGLCESEACDSSDKYRGSGGSLVCFKDGVGDILWTKHEDVEAHLKFLEGGSGDLNSEYAYLCENGTLLPATSENPCPWVAQPWQVLVANRKSAIDVQKMVELLSDQEHEGWEENFLHVIELYLEYVINLAVSRTPKDYLRGIPGYLSASAMAQGNCKPNRSVNFCVASTMEKEKCDWISKASLAIGIRPSLECIQKNNVTACLDSVSRRETDAVSVSPDFFYDAATKFKLENFLVEVGSRFSDNYLSCIAVKKKSGLKKLSDLKGKKVCLTRKGGIGWWSLLFALDRKSLIDSFCEEPTTRFGGVCLVADEENRNGKSCCQKDGIEDDESATLRCLHEDKCDAAVLDFSTLKEYSDGRSSGLWFEEFDMINENPDKFKDSHWLWSPAHYLMTSPETQAPKSQEILSFFLELGQYFGRDSRKTTPMLEIFGPFRGVKNVLFRDSSSSFATLTTWNRENNYLSILSRMKACSKSSPRVIPTLISLVALVLFTFLTTNTVVFKFSPRLR